MAIETITKYEFDLICGISRIEGGYRIKDHYTVELNDREFKFAVNQTFRGDASYAVIQTEQWKMTVYQYFRAIDSDENRERPYEDCLVEVAAFEGDAERFKHDLLLAKLALS
jgi:hypothetical protein